MPSFVDETKIEVQAGKGGDGMVAFRREKYVPHGGPAGGDGGRGGSIIFVADAGLRTLMDFRYRRKFKAEDGENGKIKAQYGKAAVDLRLKVPVGTTVYDFNSGQQLGDLTKKGQELVVARGGRGGRGNIHFATSVNRAPEMAENGAPGEDRVLRLELKMLADVGLVGFPSVGKSTLLAAATKARPKIAAYQFTTLTPNLGMVVLPDGRSYSMADLPGLIKGASKGVGLGMEFLRHIERTKVVLHLVSMDPNNGRSAFEDYQTIQNELAHYKVDLTQKKELIVCSKMDIPGAQKKRTSFERELKKHGVNKELLNLSSVTHQGLKQLLFRAADLVSAAEKEQEQKKPEQAKEVERDYVFRPRRKEGFQVLRLDQHSFKIEGEGIERLVGMVNLEHQDGVMYLARKLEKLGVDEALRKKGAKDGDDVQIGKLSFEFVQ